MSRGDGFVVLGVALALLGTARLLLTSQLVRRVLALNIASSGVLMVLVAMAYRPGDEDPDHVLHALVLTGIVITISVTAFALALVRRMEEPPDGDPERAEGDRDGAGGEDQ